ncbi:MAG: DUF4387 domain-containing protein [Desulfurococcales archaeon]|nr:DUF4387 domain-containing protein [Desulfurococcales archaeon]
MARLIDVASIIRSKNAGPFAITIDILFREKECAVKAYSYLTPERIASLYKENPSRIEVILYEPANAVKINIPRKIPAGHPGDTDVYGAQQHAPLLELEIPFGCK